MITRDIDWWAVNVVATERIPMPLNANERREVVRLLGHKLTGNELGHLLGVTDRTIERDKVSLRSQLVAS